MQIFLESWRQKGFALSNYADIHEVEMKQKDSIKAKGAGDSVRSIRNKMKKGEQKKKGSGEKGV